MKEVNLHKLDEIASYSDNWNYYGAKHIPHKVISATRELLNELGVQPEIFPTAAESIQLEYELPNGSYLEFEIQSDHVFVFSRTADGVEEEFTMDFSLPKLAEIVENFHGKN